MNHSKPQLSLIIACYNEAPHLVASVNEVLQVLRNSRLRFELIFVDDASQDQTTFLIKQMLPSIPEAQAIYHDQNRGHGQTVMDGIAASSGQVVGFLDIDLEVHCVYIPQLAQAILDQGYQVATGYRFYALQMNPNALLRMALSLGYRFVFRRLLGIPLHDPETGYKFFERQTILKIMQEVQNPGWFWDTEVMCSAFLMRARILESPCLFKRRADKKTTIRVFQYTLRHFTELWKFRKKLQARQMRTEYRTGTVLESTDK